MLDANYIVGLTDGEGSFGINIPETLSGNLGFQVQPRFRIALGKGDRELLIRIKDFFGFGSVILRVQDQLRTKGVQATDLTEFAVSSIEHCKIIRAFFSEHKLESSKRKDFQIWSACIDMILDGKHLSIEGFLQIARLRDEMNIIGKRRAVGRSQYRNCEWFRQKLLERSKLIDGKA